VPKSTEEHVTLCTVRGKVFNWFVSSTFSRCNKNESVDELALLPLVALDNDETIDSVFDLIKSVAKSLYTMVSSDTKHIPPVEGGASDAVGNEILLKTSCSLTLNAKSTTNEELLNIFPS